MSGQSRDGTNRWVNDIHQGDAAETLAEMPADSVDCVITSTPYWGKRDYLIDNQIGVESDAKQFIDDILAVMDELQRVLSGSLWLNLDDTYNGCSIIRPESMSHPDAGDDQYEKQLAKNRSDSAVKRRSSDQFGFNRQSRLFIPSRIAIAMGERGWLCRDKIIWMKESPAPEGRVNSRLTQSHEPIYRFATHENAYFDRDAVNDPVDAWKLPTANNEHPAAFAIDLAKRAIKLSTEPGDVVLDPFAGSGTTCAAAKELNRKFIGIDLNADFVAMSQARVGIDVDEPERLLEDGETSLAAYTDGGDCNVQPGTDR